jgi:anti-sigma factor (TIGR02949 family)
MNSGECERLLDQLSDYVDGELSQSMCQEIERHLAGCQNCRVVVDTLRKTVALYQLTGAEPIPGDVQERLLAVLDLKS